MGPVAHAGRAHPDLPEDIPCSSPNQPSPFRPLAALRIAIGIDGTRPIGDTRAMWSDLRADAVLRELTALASTELEVDAAHAAALAAVGRVVPFDAACIGAVDPETLLLTSGLTLGFAPDREQSERFVEIEFGRLDGGSFDALVERGTPVLADDGGLAPTRRRDLRFNELTKLIGFDHDVRMAFIVDGGCWAVGDLYRAGTTSFEARELGFLERAAPLVAVATRTAAARGGGTDHASPGAAVLVIDGEGAVTGMTAAARELLDREAGSPDPLWWALRSSVAVVRRTAAGAHTRVRLGSDWMVVRAAPLSDRGATGPVAVTIDRASPHELAGVLMAAHGMTAREREVCREVLAGRSTREIAANLYLSPHTVQDHLKSIFAKSGVSSRRELVAVLAV